MSKAKTYNQNTSWSGAFSKYLKSPVMLVAYTAACAMSLLVPEASLALGVVGGLAILGRNGVAGAALKALSSEKTYSLPPLPSSEFASNNLNIKDYVEDNDYEDYRNDDEESEDDTPEDEVNIQNAIATNDLNTAKEESSLQSSMSPSISRKLLSPLSEVDNGNSSGGNPPKMKKFP